MLNSIGPHFDQIENEIAALSGMREKPAGNVRITTVEHAAETLLWPKLVPMLLKYPDINIEIISEYGLKDIVAERYDAGVRLGEQIDKDMISFPLCEKLNFVVVGSPSYFEGKTPPVTPRDLDNHSCIKLRLPTLGNIYKWEFCKDGNEVKVHVDGQMTFATISMMRQAALDSLGLAYLPKDRVEAELKNGKLVQVLADWCPVRPAYHLYYPSRQQHSLAFMLVLDALRYRSCPPLTIS